MDELLVELGLSTTANIKKDNDYNSHFREVEFKNDFTCIICCDKKDTETFALECGHEYCINCYRHYIKDKLHEGNIITCMDCSLALKNEDIDKVMGHPSSSKLMDSSIKSFVQKHNRNYKWCPFADCKSIVHLRDTSSLPEYTRLHYSPFVKCNSFHRFCFNCGFEVHSPADCKITTAWVKKARKESEILNWVLSHTKECPKCSVNIEKNGGCNHMVCSSCKYEFCWICEGPWAPHGKNFFQCTMYKNNEDNKSKNPQDANKTLKKYTFYYRLFNEHEVSAKLDWNLGQTLGTKVHALQERIGISWIDGQFLSESLKVLNEGRTVLKWSFAVAYYSDASHNLTKIFVDNQMLLANAVESLSELLQIKTPEVIMKRRPEFYNKAGYVENRTTALMECGRELLCKGICKAAE
ncbi:CNT_collapsed_G0033690.mRNA.1.CDS.1 [Saccharomyces cerevisiae]|nr:CNT_collapsed_G0033690.mRNA.1.CDS.1 [Saccharomyces cerevisiae]